MNYYLKKTKNKDGRTYLAIDTSIYSSEKKNTVHKIYKSLGSVETLKEQGIEDPIAYYEDEVSRLKKETNESKKSGELKIRNDPFIYLGHFPLISILHRLGTEKYINILADTRKFQFSVYKMLTGLIYSCAVCPCSKYRTYTEVLPRIPGGYDKFSYDQILEAIDFIGQNYSKVVEIFSSQVKAVYGLDTSTTYYDCTNFYFEINREDDFRRKGPCKSHTSNPIVGLGLMLDRNLMPTGMIMFPGNYSEKKTLGELVERLERQQLITNRTIHVADKGLNCAVNIEGAKAHGNGYIFGKSVKMLSDDEKNAVLDDAGYVTVADADGVISYRYKSVTGTYTYEIKEPDKPRRTFNVEEKRIITYSPALARKQMHEIEKLADKATSMTSYGGKKAEYGSVAKYLIIEDEKGNPIAPKINDEAIQRDMDLAGYSVIVTSETDMPDEKVISTYRYHAHIEENFKIMKSYISARPVYVQLENRIKGHFTICYLYLLLERIFQNIELKKQFPYTAIVDFMKDFKVQDINEERYVNQLAPSKLVSYLVTKLRRPLDNYFLTQMQVDAIQNVMTISEIEQLEKEEAKKTQKRRGRPKKVKDTPADGSENTSAGDSAKEKKPRNRSGKKKTAAESQTDAAPAATASEQSASATLASTGKRRGRPKKQNTEAATDEPKTDAAPAAAAPEQSATAKTASTGKRRGRPKKQETEAHTQEPQTPGDNENSVDPLKEPDD